MKTKLILSLAILSLASCEHLTPQQQLIVDRASAVVDRALDYAVQKGKVSPEDAALVRDVGTIVLPASTTPEAPSGK